MWQCITWNTYLSRKTKLTSLPKLVILESQTISKRKGLPMTGGLQSGKASWDEKRMHWFLASRWCPGKGAEQAGTTGTPEMGQLHPSCAGKQGNDEHWGVQPRYPQPSWSVQRRRCVIIICWFNGVHCWDCNPSIASQGEITLKVKSAENSQVTCNLIRYRKREQSPELSRLEGFFCYGQAQISAVFYFFHSLMQYLPLVLNDDTFMTTKLNEIHLDCVYWK